MRLTAWLRRRASAPEREAITREGARVADEMWSAAGSGHWDLARERYLVLSDLGRRLVELGGEPYGALHGAAASFEYGSSLHRVATAARDVAAPGPA